MLMEQI
jgi:hypothetical protein